MHPVVIHDSRNTTYRYPFGAVEAGSAVTLRCDVEGDGKEKEVMLRLWQEGAGETLVAMQPETWKRKQEAAEKEKTLSVEEAVPVPDGADIDGAPAKTVQQTCWDINPISALLLSRQTTRSRYVLPSNSFSKFLYSC